MIEIEVGKAIRTARAKAGYSQFGVAHLAGVPRPYISKIERGLQLPSLRQIVRLCAVLEIEPWVLVEHACRNVSDSEPSNACTNNGAVRLSTRT